MGTPNPGVRHVALPSSSQTALEPSFGMLLPSLLPRMIDAVVTERAIGTALVGLAAFEPGGSQVSPGRFIGGGDLSERVVQSLSVIVNSVGLGVPSVAPPVGLLSVRPTVSLGSSSASGRMVTVKVLLVCPEAKVRVPEVLV